MKKNILKFISIITIVYLILTGCSQPGTSTAVVKEQQQTQDDTKTLVDKIKSMGFNTNGYFITDGKIIVEGDIAFDIENLKKLTLSESKNSNAQLKQYANSIAVSPQRVSNITIFLRDSVRWDWASAADRAINDWNNSGSAVHMTRVYSGSADITVYGVSVNDIWVGNSAFPTSDSPGNSIQINLKISDQYGYTDSQKEKTMVHEIGHTIGLRHTIASETDRILIPGTSTSDYSSVMNPGQSSWNGFTSNDLQAIWYLFGDNGTPYAIVYADPNYTGKRWIIRDNKDISNLNDISMDNAISSIQCFNGAKLYLFNYSNYNTDVQINIVGSIPNLAIYGYDNWASSILINNNDQHFVILYEHSGYQGKSLVIRGNNDYLGNNGFNDIASSIKCFNGASAILYKDSGYRGSTYCVVNSIDYLSTFNDVASSIVVF